MLPIFASALKFISHPAIQWLSVPTTVASAYHFGSQLGGHEVDQTPPPVIVKPQHTELANNIDHSLDFIKNNKATIGGAIGAGALLGAGLLGSKNMLLKPPIRRN